VSWRAVLMKLWFSLRGVDPEAVVVCYATGDDGLFRSMTEEARQLIPDRRHYLVHIGESDPTRNLIGLRGGTAGDLYLQLRHALRGLRVGMAPVLFTGDSRHHSLRAAAFLFSPTRILAYNSRLERHHLQLRCALASLLFFLGVPLDRIWLRPRGWPGRRERSTTPDTVEILEGRPTSPSRAQVSVLSPYVPYPLSHGGAVRMFHLLREAAITHDIFLFAFIEDDKPADLTPLLAFCARITLVPKPRYREPRWASLDPPEVCEYRSPAMQHALQAAPRPLQTEYTQLASYGGDILVEHDITFDLFLQVHNRRQTLSCAWDLWRWRRFESRALRNARIAVVMSDKDAALSQHPWATVIPNGVDLQRFTTVPEPGGCRILFIGSFRHFPNVGAFRFFLGEVWQRLRQALPEAEFTAVAGPDAALYWPERALPSAPGLQLLEFVADVKPLYERANLVIVPTLVSAGTNIKLLEAMAMERAVVSTSSGCAGLGLRHAESVWIADSPDDFLEACLTLLQDQTLRRSLAANARLLAEQRFSWRRLGALQRDLLRQLAPPPVVIRPAEPADLHAIASLQAASPEASTWDPASYLNQQCLLAEFENRPAGFAAFRQTAPREWELLNLAVNPDWRRQGMGSQLLAAVLEQMEGEMFLEVRASNIAAQTLYRRCGFQVTGLRPGYYENPPEPAIVMRLRFC